ncbi:hypothetical protein H5410_030020 [Solanum commersonii]|uniref:Uncharacterized protein n=1 Tax=Solanum commersonii TaxID=4109 RepID=A0A9J5YEK2_SOLCO|nr:hypothetical protein H5410_030020 [Solanum commersonii]
MNPNKPRIPNSFGPIPKTTLSITASLFVVFELKLNVGAHCHRQRLRTCKREPRPSEDNGKRFKALLSGDGVAPGINC